LAFFYRGLMCAVQSGHIVPGLEINADNRPGEELPVEKSTPKSAPDILKKPGQRTKLGK